MKTNYHTHTLLCRHAVGDVEDYVLEAISKNFDILGFSDHAPLKFASENKQFGQRRMLYKELDIYLNKLDKAIEKYSDKIKIYKGFEIEFYEKIDTEYYDELLKKCDYLILGHHRIIKDNKVKSSFFLETDDDVMLYATKCVEAMKSQYFSLVAHPDLFACHLKEFNQTCVKASHMILKAAETYDVPLEINANGTNYGRTNETEFISYPYPRFQFWEIAKNYNVKIFINSDAHDPKDLDGQKLKNAKIFSEQFGFRIEEELKLKNITK